MTLRQELWEGGEAEGKPLLRANGLEQRNTTCYVCHRANGSLSTRSNWQPAQTVHVIQKGSMLLKRLFHHFHCSPCVVTPIFQDAIRPQCNRMPEGDTHTVKRAEERQCESFLTSCRAVCFRSSLVCGLSLSRSRSRVLGLALALVCAALGPGCENRVVHSLGRRCCAGKLSETFGGTFRKARQPNPAGGM